MAIISADININRKLENQRERGETFEKFIFPTHAVSSLSEMLKIILPTPNIIVVVNSQWRKLCSHREKLF